MTTKTTKRADLPETAIQMLGNARQRDEDTRGEFAQRILEQGSTYAMRWHGEEAAIAEHMLPWHKAIEHSLSDKGFGLEALHAEITDRLLDWTPTNSTCPFSNATGDAERKALKKARELTRNALLVSEAAKKDAEKKS